jgi:putative transposase
MNIGKFKGKYRIPANRLLNYDYGSNGLYFITICTKEKIHYFGEIVETRDGASFPIINGYAPSTTQETRNHASIQMTEMGAIANEYWQSIPEHYPFVILDEFVVMPNHIHSIIAINKKEEKEWQPNAFGIQSRNLGAIIRGFKSSVKRYANERNIEFYWQARYHDHIIQNEKTLFAVRNYIMANPANWPKNMNNNPGLKM